MLQIPEEKGFWWDSYKEQGLPPAALDDLEESAEGMSLRDALDNLLREAKDKFRGYDSCFTPEQQVTLAYKKVCPTVCSVSSWPAPIPCSHFPTGPSTLLLLNPTTNALCPSSGVLVLLHECLAQFRTSVLFI